MADIQNDKEDTRQWFLRINGETVFGPVSTQGLIVWAEQGRVLPGHEVSTDRKKWVQAVSVDLLDMKWFVDDGGGELRGPLNRLAAEALIKSGKVADGAQLVSADDVDAGSSEDVPEPAERAALQELPKETMPEEVLRRRIRELENMVSEQRDRLSKLSNAGTCESVQQERDVLAGLLKEAETQRDTILRNAEKDARAHDRKMDMMRQQVKKLEQQLEDVNSRLVLSEADAAGRSSQPGEAEMNALLEKARLEGAEKTREECGAREAGLKKEIEAFRTKIADAERTLAEVRSGDNERSAAWAKERTALTRRLDELEKGVREGERQCGETARALAVCKTELDDERSHAAALNARAVQAESSAREALAKAAEREAAFTELLNDANARDNTYREKIAALEKTCALSPEETSRFYADQSAVYELVKKEVDEISRVMEMERNQVAQLKTWSAERQQALTERRQALLRHMGNSPEEMTRRTIREQPSDPQATRMRAELENLRVTYQREVEFAETRERESQEKIRFLELECSRLQTQTMESEKQIKQKEELEERLRRNSQELADERRSRAGEQEQFAASQKALLMRIETLERSSNGK